MINLVKGLGFSGVSRKICLRLSQYIKLNAFFFLKYEILQRGNQSISIFCVKFKSIIILLFWTVQSCFLCVRKHISRQAVDKYWRRQFIKLNLDHKGFSTHSCRRWLITQLAHNGIDVKTIQQITGHKSINVLLEYVEADEKRISNALATVQT